MRAEGGGGGGVHTLTTSHRLIDAHFVYVSTRRSLQHMQAYASADDGGWPLTKIAHLLLSRSTYLYDNYAPSRSGLALALTCVSRTLTLVYVHS